jgi:hypothetical protein
VRVAAARAPDAGRVARADGAHAPMKMEHSSCCRSPIQHVSNDPVLIAVARIAVPISGSAPPKCELLVNSISLNALLIESIGLRIAFAEYIFVWRIGVTRS